MIHLGAGFPINWAMPVGNTLATHPLYIKYSSTEIDQLNAGQIRASLGAILPRAETAEVIAYLSWLLRVVELLGD